MQCGCCHMLQHAHCYGFLSTAPRDEHFCYQCLLEDSDKPRLEDLRRLAQFRRVLFVLHKENPHSQSALAKTLGNATTERP